LPEKPFQKWGLNFIRPIKSASHYSSDEYILITIDYAIKWVEARTLCTNIVVVTTKFLYDQFFTQFNYPLTIIIDQSTHFINNAIHYLANHFILKPTNFIIYYPQWNGQAESTSKVFETLILTKLVNEN
jgi:hypothetical protein